MDLTPELINIHTVIIDRTKIACSNCNRALDERMIKSAAARCPSCATELTYVALTFWQDDETYGVANDHMRSRFPELIFIGWARGQYGSYTIVDGLILDTEQDSELIDVEVGRA